MAGHARCPFGARGLAVLHRPGRAARAADLITLAEAAKGRHPNWRVMWYGNMPLVRVACSSGGQMFSKIDISARRANVQT